MSSARARRGQREGRSACLEFPDEPVGESALHDRTFRAYGLNTSSNEVNMPRELPFGARCTQPGAYDDTGDRPNGSAKARGSVTGPSTGSPVSMRVAESFST